MISPLHGASMGLIVSADQQKQVLEVRIAREVVCLCIHLATPVVPLSVVKSARIIVKTNVDRAAATKGVPVMSLQAEGCFRFLSLVNGIQMRKTRDRASRFTNGNSCKKTQRKGVLFFVHIINQPPHHDHVHGRTNPMREFLQKQATGWPTIFGYPLSLPSRSSISIHVF